MALTSKPARALTDQPLASLFIPQDIERVDRALVRIDEGERVRHLLLHTRGDANRPPKPVALAGYVNPDRPGIRLVALTHAAALEVPVENRAAQSGLLGRDDFSTLARRMMDEGCAAAAPEEAYQLTMLEVPQVESVRSAVGAVKAEEFVAELGGRLKSVSVGGDAAGALGQNRYGIIHSPTVTPTAIETAISDLVGAFMPDAKSEPIKSATIALDAAGISSEEATNALLYSLNRFARGDDISLDNMARDVRGRLSATVAQMRDIKEIIDQGKFELVFQPVVDLWSDVVHHFECLVRFPGSASPFETVTFAENVGIIGNLDMAILNRAIAFMRSPACANPSLRFAVNLSGRSLSNGATARRLIETAAGCTDLRGRLLFELTETAEVDDLPAVNGVLQALRSKGFPVCLDDFGAGSAAFHYLRALEVDHVKIDGIYVREMSRSDQATPYLKAIAHLCDDLKIGTIAEFVETNATANLLKLLKVRHGQGYLFGKPMQPDTGTDNPLKGWAINGLAWHKGMLIYRNSAPQPKPIKFKSVDDL
jgi:EAL domain-containing protein (putative c-di-GMP-specific phosphodiesterase class I)